MTHDDYLIENELNSKIKPGGHKFGTVYMVTKYVAENAAADVLEILHSIEYQKCLAIAEIRLTKAELEMP